MMSFLPHLFYCQNISTTLIPKYRSLPRSLILDIGMEKEQKQELGWRVSVLPIPAFHHCEIYNYSASSVIRTAPCSTKWFCSNN